MANIQKEILTNKMNRFFGQNDHVFDFQLDISAESKGIVIAEAFRKATSPFFYKNHKKGMTPSNCKIEITIFGFDIGYDLGKFHSRVIFELRKVLKEFGFERPSFSLEYRRSDERPHIEFKMSFRDVDPLLIFRTENGGD